jgi:hypothetical protein
MAEEKWRVQVKNPQGVVFMESLFKSETSARDYFDSLCLPGNKISLQVRRAGEARFQEIEGKEDT